MICGHHWKSDIDASLELAACIFAVVVSTADYQQQMVKARQEYLKITGGTDGVRATNDATPSSTAAIYDLKSQRLTDSPSALGVYIQNGQKTVFK